jgi:glycosyltransferase involved in cell wall biosynthesis
MTADPRISVVVPAFNRVEFLPEAIESVLEQTVDCWELIVVDDGSTEDVRGAVAPYLSDRRISYNRRPNGGRCLARNDGASRARGDLLCFLDDDDRYAPDGLESLLSAFGTGEEIGMVVGGYDLIDEHGDTIGVRRPWEEGGELDLEGWLVKGYAIPASTMIGRRWFDRVHGFDPGVETGEDRDLFIRLARAGCRMEWMRRSVCSYRKYPGNTDRRTQRDALIMTLRRAFRDPSLPRRLTEQEGRALSGVYAYFARGAAAAGDDAFVRENLSEIAALRAEPTWRREGMLISPQGFPAEIQLVVEDVVRRCEREHLDAGVELDRLAGLWGVSPRDLRRAWAQREVRAFFAALEDRDLETAGAHRRHVLSLDPRWLAYRTLLVFPLRRLAARASSS